MAWQQLSTAGAGAEMWAYPLPIRRQQTVDGKIVPLPRRGKRPPREPNRLLEIMGVMGGMGEQLALAWTFEQDVQRFVATSSGREPEHQRMIQRALAEASGHFVLGAAHSLGNLVLRLLLLNDGAATFLATTKPYRRANGFPPFSDAYASWLTFNSDLLNLLQATAATGGNRFMTSAVEAVKALHASDRFRALDNRRGMDYHRRRPQSVEHASPRREAITTANGVRTMTMFGSSLDPEADADRVHDAVVGAMQALCEAMYAFRKLLGKAIRAEKIAFVEA